MVRIRPWTEYQFSIWNRWRSRRKTRVSWSPSMPRRWRAWFRPRRRRARPRCPRHWSPAGPGHLHLDLDAFLALAGLRRRSVMAPTSPVRRDGCRRRGRGRSRGSANTLFGGLVAEGADDGVVGGDDAIGRRRQRRQPRRDSRQAKSMRALSAAMWAPIFSVSSSSRRRARGPISAAKWSRISRPALAVDGISRKRRALARGRSAADSRSPVPPCGRPAPGGSQRAVVALLPAGEREEDGLRDGHLVAGDGGDAGSPGGSGRARPEQLQGHPIGRRGRRRRVSARGGPDHGAGDGMLMQPAAGRRRGGRDRPVSRTM